ncbi:MPI1A phosphatase, partial [Polyodon spathula]|nr:MPI1A phosphatase [Polyodon spathula]
MEAAAPAQSTVADSSEFWRRSGECRRRKAASPNIFQGVNMQQLQRLFRRSGDQRAEQRAELVWEHGNESELAQALIGLRQGRSRRHRTGRGAVGPVWLKTFGKMRLHHSTRTQQEGKRGERRCRVKLFTSPTAPKSKWESGGRKSNSPESEEHSNQSRKAASRESDPEIHRVPPFRMVQSRQQVPPVEMPDPAAEDRNLIGDFSRVRNRTLNFWQYLKICCLQLQYLTTAMCFPASPPLCGKGRSSGPPLHLTTDGGMELEDHKVQNSSQHDLGGMTMELVLIVVLSILIFSLQVASVLRGEYNSAVERYLIIDCRYPYECRFLRKIDRNLNVYPQLFYPEMYILKGGYKEFYSQFQSLCEPCGYVLMVHQDFTDQLRRYRRKKHSRPSLFGRRKELVEPDMEA